MFIAVPVGMNYRTERLPLVTLSLIGLNTLVWLVTLVSYLSTDGASDDWIMQHLWLIPAQSHLWMYLTSMFVHAGIFHLLGNMIFLFLFGSCVEDIIGRLRFAIYYLAGGLVAEFAYVAMTPEHFVSTIPMGGASGAISAAWACICCCARTRTLSSSISPGGFSFTCGRANSRCRRGWRLSFISRWILIGAVIGMFSEHGSGVAFGAHVGGFLGGLGLVAFYNWKVRPREEAAAPRELIIDPVAVIAEAKARNPAAFPTSETPTIFLHDGTEQTGPFTLTQVQAKLRQGEINLDARYWSDGMDDWQDVVELSDQPIA